MEENGNQREDQHERSIEFTCDFLSIYQLIQAGGYNGSSVLGLPRLCRVAPPPTLISPPALPDMLPWVFTWGKLTILIGIMDSRSLGEERRDESQGGTRL